MTTTTLPPPKQFTSVNDLRLAHVEMGRGDPIVLLHGNPTTRRCPSIAAPAHGWSS